MEHKTVEEYILSMPNAKLEYPFGEDVAVYKVFVPTSLASHLDGVQGAGEQQTETYNKYDEGAAQPATTQSAKSTSSAASSASGQAGAVRGEWKMFALIAEKKKPVQLSLKCDPLLAVTLREKYESVLPGQHLNKKHWNTIILSGQLSDQEIQDLILHSYTLVTGI